MKPSPSRKLKALLEFGVVLALVALLIAAPACSFIEGLMGGDEGQADGGAVAQVDGSAAGSVPQPPPVVPPTGMPDAAAALAAAMKNVPDGGLPPGIDPSKLPPGIDPSKLPPGFDPSKIPDGGLPPGFDPSKIPDGGLPPGIDPSKLAGLDPSQLPPGVDPADLAAGKVPPSAGIPEGADPATLAALSKLTPEQRSQLQEAVQARAKLSNQIRRLNYIIDRNLTKNPADVVRLNRYVRAKREIDSRLNALRREHDIPEEVFRNMLKTVPTGNSDSED